MTSTIIQQQNNHDCQQTQQGFTLIELLIAMVIFAMLTVAGWQVFDTLNRSKNTANRHASYLSELQYTYLQLQNDMNQVVAWQTAHNEQRIDNKVTEATNNNKNADDENGKDGKDGENGEENKNPKNNNDAKNTPAVSYEIPQFLELNSESLSFIRFLDPDPRYKSSPTMSTVSYTVQSDNLVRRQINSLSSANINDEGITSVLLKNVEQVSWQALMPEPVSNFSASDASEDTSGNSYKGKEEPPLLPKGIKLNFVYQDMPIEWVFALPQASPNMTK